MICPPALVSIDSGWNCTPQYGSSRCAIPMIVPSSLRASTSRHDGKSRSATRRLW